MILIFKRYHWSAHLKAKIHLENVEKKNNMPLPGF
tara:strand:+ start:416 stop:520 length:105 start_codon:yes stop_codon:yes gene_type:complete